MIRPIAWIAGIYILLSLALVGYRRAFTTKYGEHYYRVAPIPDTILEVEAYVAEPGSNWLPRPIRWSYPPDTLPAAYSMNRPMPPALEPVWSKAFPGKNEPAQFCAPDHIWADPRIIQANVPDILLLRRSASVH